MIDSDDVEDKELMHALYKMQLDEERYESACSDLKKLSAAGWNAFKESPGEHFNKPKYGYQRILDYLIGKIPKQAIHMNEKVENIDWSSDDVVVKTDSNVYYCQTVLCTVPLGFLKRNHKQLFTPNLPEEKVNSIEKLGFGDANKIFTVFDHQVLPKNTSDFTILYKDGLEFQLEQSNAKWSLNVFKFATFYEC